MTSRRSFLASVAAAFASAAAFEKDPERALWVPGRKLISIAAPVFLAVGDVVIFSQYSERFIVTTEARSMARIRDARFRIDSPPSGDLLPRDGLYCSEWALRGPYRPQIVRA